MVKLLSSLGKKSYGVDSKRPFLSCLLPLYQNESLRKTIHMEMCSDCRFIFVPIKLFFIWKVCRKTRFETLRHKVTRKWPIWPVDKSQSFIRSLPSSLSAVRKQTALDSSDCKSGNMELPVELHMHIGQTHIFVFLCVLYLFNFIVSTVKNENLSYELEPKCIFLYSFSSISLKELSK